MIPQAIDLSIRPLAIARFDAPANRGSCVEGDPASTAAAVIDPVMDIEHARGRITPAWSDAVIAHLRDQGLTREWLTGTPVHADPPSGAPCIRSRSGGKIGIGPNITIVQQTCGKVFDSGAECPRDGSQCDRRFQDGDACQIGGMQPFATHTSSHTPACITPVVGDAAFVGDAFCRPDGGLAPADFPRGDARTAYRSIRRAPARTETMRLFLCHDHGPNDRELGREIAVVEQRAHSLDMRDDITADPFLAIRVAQGQARHAHPDQGRGLF